jgi:hypothetical protein
MHYSHPLRANDEENALASTDHRIDWLRSFSPGNMPDAVFDQADWHFVPVGGWSEVSGTGPHPHRSGADQFPRRRSNERAVSTIAGADIQGSTRLSATGLGGSATALKCRPGGALLSRGVVDALSLLRRVLQAWARRLRPG